MSDGVSSGYASTLRVCMSLSPRETRNKCSTTFARTVSQVLSKAQPDSIVSQVLHDVSVIPQARTFLRTIVLGDLLCQISKCIEVRVRNFALDLQLVFMCATLCSTTCSLVCIEALTHQCAQVSLMCIQRSFTALSPPRHPIHRVEPHFDVGKPPALHLNHPPLHRPPPLSCTTEAPH